MHPGAVCHVHESECIPWGIFIEQQRFALAIKVRKRLRRRVTEIRRSDNGSWDDLGDGERELPGSPQGLEVLHALCFCSAVSVVRGLERRFLL